MAVKEFHILQDELNKINNDKLYVTICKNLKKYRLEKYTEYKKSNTNNNINPYSSENIAALLDYNHNHYKRFESMTDSTKRMPFEKIVKLSIILEKSIEELIEE